MFIKKNLPPIRKIRKMLSVLLTFSVIFTTIPISYASDNHSASVTIPYDDANNDGINDYSLEFGMLSSYYVYDYFSPSVIKKSDNSNDSDCIETYHFDIENKNITSCFYRVSNPVNEHCVTYGSYIDPRKISDVVVTRQQMYEDNNDFNKNTVIDDFSLNEYDTGDIYLNINEKGHISLQSGESYTLYPLRNWLAVEGITCAKVLEPDFHYEIINLSGNDFLSVKENDTYSSLRHSAEITANGAGTAIVMVTYDSMTAMGMTNRENVFYSAIRPENTGVFIVTSDISSGTESGMIINSGSNNPQKKLSGDYIDYEHDILYYTGSGGAEYSFTPEKNTVVSVLRPQYINGKMSFDTEFSKDNITANSDGLVTIGGLYEGSNIIRLENGERVDYQIIRAKRLDYSISFKRSQNETQNEIQKENAYAGDTVTIKFDRLYHPANKLSGIYNNSAQIFYKDLDGTKITGNSSQYTFASDINAQTLEFKIPSDFAGSVYTLTGGCIMTIGFGSAFGSHRSITYSEGKQPNFNAAVNVSYLGALPDINIPLSQNNSDIPETPITVTVSAYDYTAAENKLDGASENGVILDKFPVKINSSVTAADAVKKAFEENNISSEGLENGYISSINKLSENGGYSGWVFSYNNDDYSNAGLSSIKLSDGDSLRFDYSCNFDCMTDDIGHGWYGRPFLTELKLGDTVVKMNKSISYDENNNIIEKFYINDTEMNGAGTAENPFEIPAVVSGGLSELTAEISTNLNKHYRIVSGLYTQQDFSAPVVFSLSSLGGKYKTFYSINASKNNTNNSSENDKNKDTVSVTFRLIGATKSSRDVDLSRGEKGYNGSEYVTWIKTKSYKMKKDSTVYDLIEKALNDNDIDFDYENDTYISSITAPSVYGGYDLKEFTNGNYSGWMYTVNGVHSTLPVSQYTLKNSAKIILHYINDYRYESADWTDGNASSDNKFHNAWLSAADKEPPAETEKPETQKNIKQENTSPSPSASPTAETDSFNNTPSPAPSQTSVPAQYFSDISASDKYYDAISYVYLNKLMKGTEKNIFSPDLYTSRAMLVTILYRMDNNNPIYDGNSDKYDVSKDVWYYSPAIWSVDRGIISDSGGILNMDSAVTREQLALILYRYAKLKGCDLSYRSDSSVCDAYRDYENISSYALGAVLWAVQNNLLNTDNALIMPQGNVTRAQTAQIIMNFYENIIKECLS